ncbi:MAG: hypothetical protein KTQ49_05195 [Candidatus Omnitrophica bacterium]|nr:hypothetical protein [Candidatus Omnitrophota bacterium]
MPSQSIPVPPDTVEVQAELMNAVYGDETTLVEIFMPDGSFHALQSLPASVHVASRTDDR